MVKTFISLLAIEKRRRPWRLRSGPSLSTIPVVSGIRISIACFPLSIYSYKKRRLSEEDLKDGFILDGGFRTIEEIEGYQDLLEKAGSSMPVEVVLLRIPGWLGAQRILTSKREREDDELEPLLKRMTNYYHDLGK